MKRLLLLLVITLLIVPANLKSWPLPQKVPMPFSESYNYLLVGIREYEGLSWIIVIEPTEIMLYIPQKPKESK